MQDNPPPDLIIAQVRKALDDGLPPGFPQKVAANALGIASRELFDTDEDNAAELERLGALVGREGDVVARNRRLAELIRSKSGKVSDEVIGHLIATTLAKLKVDQPQYPALQQLTQAD